MAQYKLSKKSMSTLVGVHPSLSFAVMEAIKITEQDFTVLDGVRSIEKQKQYFAEGSSRTMDSYHLYGLAVDLVAYTPEGLSWDEALYSDINIAMKTIIEEHDLPIEWGFDMWGWDMPHYQLTGKKEEYDIRTLMV